MKCWERLKTHISLIMVTVASFCTVTVCLLLLVFVRNELKHVEDFILQVNRDVDENSAKSWKFYES
ncbi:hypothetical protein ANCCAN_20785 [Ancylostoma caninum]|uniref:Nematode cuticle collagen N-terminal domain-containing protein n=1 Tax=Ancylostoma caninum TaxID=29170 RepID=A0A368FMC6_ANCCA|nr:hypothetical protein ANCCAN_20785 [Ancylostoma caninum]